jgi:hypothetical protein
MIRETTPDALEALADAYNVGVSISCGHYYALIPVPDSDRAVLWSAVIPAAEVTR